MRRNLRRLWHEYREGQPIAVWVALELKRDRSELALQLRLEEDFKTWWFERWLKDYNEGA